MAKAHGEELRRLHHAGCRYVQMDDTNVACLCDEKMREAAGNCEPVARQHTQCSALTPKT